MIVRILHCFSYLVGPFLCFLVVYYNDSAGSHDYLESLLLPIYMFSPFVYELLVRRFVPDIIRHTREALNLNITLVLSSVFMIFFFDYVSFFFERVCGFTMITGMIAIMLIDAVELIFPLMLAYLVLQSCFFALRGKVYEYNGIRTVINSILIKLRTKS